MPKCCPQTVFRSQTFKLAHPLKSMLPIQQISADRDTRTLLMVGNHSLGNSLADGIHLGSMTTSRDADANVNISEAFFAQEVNGFPNLPTEDFGTEVFQRRSVDLQDTTSILNICHSYGSFLQGDISELAGCFSRQKPNFLRFRKLNGWHDVSCTP